jgi:hypothetical protein
LSEILSCIIAGDLIFNTVPLAKVTGLEWNDRIASGSLAAPGIDNNRVVYECDIEISGGAAAEVNALNANGKHEVVGRICGHCG